MKCAKIVISSRFYISFGISIRAENKELDLKCKIVSLLSQSLTINGLR